MRSGQYVYQLAKSGIVDPRITIEPRGLLHPALPVVFENMYQAIDYKYLPDSAYFKTVDKGRFNDYEEVLIPKIQYTK